MNTPQVMIQVFFFHSVIVIASLLMVFHKCRIIYISEIHGSNLERAKVYY